MIRPEETPQPQATKKAGAKPHRPSSSSPSYQCQYIRGLLVGEFGGDLKLEPVFDVVVERRLWNVDENGSRIEVVVDHGEANSGERISRIREAEVELKDGNPADLFAFARKIYAITQFRFGVRSKAERGFMLIDGQKSVFKAEPIHLDQEMDASSAFQAISFSCVRHFRLNEELLRSKGNPEALHQTRVALRRLRSAFSLFKAIIPGEEPRRLKEELQWLAVVFGEARNIDVLLLKATDADLVRRLKIARDATYRDAIEALDSFRTRALLLDLLQWLECGEYLPGNGASSVDIPKAKDFAAGALEKQRKRLKKDGKALATVDDEHRHEVRKDAKKFRYAAEFFGPLFDDKRSSRRQKKFLYAMEALQDDLGALNDLATGPDVLVRHGLDQHPASDTVVIHADKDKLIEKAQASVDEMLDTKRFRG
ncbi:CHAD domain-containing protein [Rhizobium leguminosarum bv. viciae]|nr:CHAD domain-containing protein [Rhizobium leguminosarum bv. viciae]